jgi:hypothetical protein
MKLLVPLVLAMLVGSVSAQDAGPTRNATVEEIQGNWELLPLPVTLEPDGQPNLWPSECQFFGYGASGELKSVDKLRGPCERMTSAQADQVFAAVKPVVTWRYDMSPVYHKAVIVVTRSDVAHYMEVWGPEVVTTAFTKDGVEFKQGDLLLSLANLKEHKIVWIRHLRRLQ